MSIQNTDPHKERLCNSQRKISIIFFPHMESMKINYFLDWFYLFQEDNSQLKTYTEVMALFVSPYLSGILRFRFSSLPGLHSSVLFPSQLCFPAKVLCIRGSPNLYVYLLLWNQLSLFGEKQGTEALGDLHHLLVNSAMHLKVYSCNLPNICMFSARRAFQNFFSATLMEIWDWTPWP